MADAGGAPEFPPLPDWKKPLAAAGLKTLKGYGPAFQVKVLQGRKGGVPKERVLNALSLAQFRAHLEARKARRKATGKRRITGGCTAQ